MTRLNFVTPESATAEQKLFCEELLGTRGGLTNIFLTLAVQPELGRGVLAMATALRKSTHLPRRLRELAVVCVGIETGARYELVHHWKAALAVGIPAEQLQALPDYRTSQLFTQEERAVVDFAVACTRSIRISPEVWAFLDFLTEAARLELVLTVSWYNCVARIIESTEIEIEDGVSFPDVPSTLVFR